ncbi:MAG: DUF2851 family protein [Rhodothermales bacterium]|nr:DUF2851 family protein [Rhodothermales bacterium]
MPTLPLARFYGASEEVFEVTVHEPAGARRPPEAFVHDLWQHRRYTAAALTTTDGLPIEVLDPGRPNTDQGPDFLHARIRIDGEVHEGAVEIHTTSGDWFAHAHHRDRAYDGVILHVTLHTDVWTGALLRQDGTRLPEAALYPALDTPLRTLLHRFHTQDADDLPCGAGFAAAPAALRDGWIDALAAERMDHKRAALAEQFLRTPDPEALLHERLFAALGYAKNAEPMTALARRIPLTIARTIEDVRDLEALHLGTAGLLPEPGGLLDADRATADAVMAMRARYQRLRLVHAIERMDPDAWRFFRLRPANFPPLRVAQGVVLVHSLLRRDPIGRLLDAACSPAPVPALRRVLRAVPGSFWQTHVRLDRPARPRDPALGRPRRDALIANAVVPVLLLLAEHASDLLLEGALLDVLRALPASSDEVTRRFAAHGTRARTAYTVQGLHQLYRTRCTEARCLSCAIGRHLLANSCGPDAR